MKKQKRVGMIIAVALLCLLPMIGAIVMCSYEVEKSLEAEIRKTLQDVAEQSSALLESETEHMTDIPSDYLKNLLSVEAFQGKGYSCIIREDGTAVAHSAGSPICHVDNFMSYEEQETSAAAIEKFSHSLMMGGSGTGSFELDGDGKQEFVYRPVTVAGQRQYLFLAVPEDVLAARVKPIKTVVYQMVIIIMIIIGSGVAIFWMTYCQRKKQLLKLAYTDSLTQGENYASFQRKMKKKRGVPGYILAMDIRGFKIINNTCGVATGDEVLARVWSVLHSSLREGELASRLYADRFIVFWEEQEQEKVKTRLEQLVADMEKIAEQLHTPHTIPVIGAYQTNNLSSIETDYGNAVQAKHLVKGRRDRNYAFYDEVDHVRVMEKRMIEDNFEQAMLEKQFEIWYQPKYNAESETISGAEALVRWRKTDGSLMPPVKFIPVYEKNGMIPKLDEYVFRTVCMQQKKWEREGRRLLPISVNISRVSLYYLNIVERYKAIAAEYGVDTEYVQLEITESATIGNSGVANLIEQFHQAGFQMLLDDFGSGYSSLSTLNTMHFDIMKLDKSLIDYIGDENGEKLLHYITRLGQNLGLRITAEGVESKEQVEFLRRLHCDDIQGYYFSKPLESGAFGELLR